MGGFVDVIMLKFNPWIEKSSPLNKALDACHKANIGLVSMKQIAGQCRSDRTARSLAQGTRAHAGSRLAARDLDRRAILELVRDDAE